MAETLPYYIAGISLIAAILYFKKLHLLRWTIMFVGLGAGQIYIYTAALGIFLIVENRLKINLKSILRPTLVSLIIILSISLITALKGYDFRQLSEITQMLAYFFIYLLLLQQTDNLKNIEDIIRSGAFGAAIVSTLAIISVFLNINEEPYIFFGRGANEGGAFISIIGVLFSITLFNKNKNPMYLLFCGIHLYANLLATSRGGTAISIIALITGFFFFTNSKVLRVILLASGVYGIFSSIPQIQFAIQDQVNFSTRERTLLVQYGWDVAKERLWTGWGWGSTSEIAAQAPTVGVYPHFHNAYIQLIVELGLLGWLLIAGFFYFIVSRSFIAAANAHESWIPTLVVGGSLSLVVSALFDAMLFGADRALQVVVVMALIGQATVIVRRQTYDGRYARPRRALKRFSLANSSVRLQRRAG